MAAMSTPPVLSRAQLQALRDLHRRAGREAAGRFLVEGRKSVLELLASTWPVIAVYAAADTQPLLAPACAARGIPCQVLSVDLLSRASTFERNDSALAVVPLHPWREQPVSNDSLTLVLDDLRDPGNLGTILRLADWYGVRQVVCSPTTVDVTNSKTLAASMGSFLRIPVLVRELPAWLAMQQAGGICVAGAVLDGEDVHHLPVPFRGGVLVIGNESHGLSPALQALLDRRLTIPRFGAAESLNAAMATAILLDGWRRVY